MVRAGYPIVLLALIVSTAHGGEILDVDTCGQIVPERARARLASDLDCTGASDPTFSSVTLGRGARLALEGHTITGGNRGILCSSDCRVDGPGTIIGAEYGLSARKVRLTDVQFRLNSQAAVEGDAKVVGSQVLIAQSNWLGIRSAKKVRLTDSEIRSCFLEGIDASRVILKDSVLVANGVGVLARTSVKLIRSTLSNVGGQSDFDIRSIRFPRLIASTCSGESEDYSTGFTWGVCARD